MRLARLAPLASVGLCVLSVSGCYSPSPYSNPYGTPYGYPAAPVQTLTPGGTYTPGLPPGSYSSPTPSGSFSQPTPSGSTYQQGGSSSDAPFFSPSSAAPYDGGGVPKYGDPGEVQFQQSKPKPIADQPNLFEQGSLQAAGASTANVAKVVADSADFFEPVRAEPQEPQPTLADGVVTVPGSQSPYAHDADGYRWLRGLARLNEKSGGWSLVYSTVDIDGDPFQGWLTLAPDPRLDQLRSNQAYLISGRLDESRTDSAGKPLYRIESITGWEPSTTFFPSGARGM